MVFGAPAGKQASRGLAIFLFRIFLLLTHLLSVLMFGKAALVSPAVAVDTPFAFPSSSGAQAASPLLPRPHSMHKRDSPSSPDPLHSCHNRYLDFNDPQFVCADGSGCVNLTSRCDHSGSVDCADGSDEFGCYKRECDESEWACVEDLTCIPDSAICDGKFDCPDRTDEATATCSFRWWHECPVSGSIQCGGHCVPPELQCDGQCSPGCPSCLDEHPVLCFSNCGADEFTCGFSIPSVKKKSSECLDYSHVCDGTEDCADGSDEVLCDVMPSPHVQLFKDCSGDLGAICGFVFVSHENVEKNETGDYLESLGVTTECAIDNETRSLDERCEPICSDPLGVPCSLPISVKDAGNGSPLLTCVPHEAFCNGTTECPNGADELLCSHLKCNDSSGHFHCATSGECIARSLVCDGFYNCMDESDESRCGGAQESMCTASQFYCPSEGKCLELSDACELDVTCGGSPSLISDICSRLCVNQPDGFCPHNAHCVDTPDRARCDCKDVGHVFNETEWDCVDKDECNPVDSSEPYVCQQLCANAPPPIRYTCSCYPGYSLQPTSTSSNDSNPSICRANTGGAFLLVAARKLIAMKLPLSKDSTTQISLNISYPPDQNVADKDRFIAFAAVDYPGKAFYFQDMVSFSIYKTTVASWDMDRLSVDGEPVGRTRVFVNGSSAWASIEGMAVDYSSGNLYWVERKPQSRIHMTTSDGKHDVAVVTRNIDRARELSLHVPKRYLYWTDWGLEQLWRSSFNGKDPTLIIALKLDFVNSVHVDEFSDRLYFLDAKYDLVESSDLHGNDRRIVFKAPKPFFHQPFSVTTFEELVYWSDWGSDGAGRHISACNKLSCHDSYFSIPHPAQGSIHLTAVHESLQDLRRVDDLKCGRGRDASPCGDEESLCISDVEVVNSTGAKYTCYYPFSFWTCPSDCIPDYSDRQPTASAASPDEHRPASISYTRHITLSSDFLRCYCPSRDYPMPSQETTTSEPSEKPPVDPGETGGEGFALDNLPVPVIIVGGAVAMCFFFMLLYFIMTIIYCRCCGNQANDSSQAQPSGAYSPCSCDSEGDEKGKKGNEDDDRGEFNNPAAQHRRRANSNGAVGVDALQAEGLEIEMIPMSNGYCNAIYNRSGSTSSGSSNDSSSSISPTVLVDMRPKRPAKLPPISNRDGHQESYNAGPLVTPRPTTPARMPLQSIEEDPDENEEEESGAPGSSQGSGSSRVFSFPDTPSSARLIPVETEETDV